MPRYSARSSKARDEALAKGIVLILGMCALAVGGFAHFAQALISLVVVGMGLLVIAIGLFALWKSCRFKPTTAGGISGNTSTPYVYSQPFVSSPTVEILRQIDWYQFEKLMERLLKLEGYHVTRFGGAMADGGVDVLAERAGKRVVVQCKHWKSPVIPATVREAIGIRVSQHADEVVLATLNSGTTAALELAQQHGVEVTDEDGIFGRMQRFGLGEFTGLLDPSNKCCPRCDAPMVLRTGRGKTFWGCSNYGPSRCTGTIEA